MKPSDLLAEEGFNVTYWYAIITRMPQDWLSSCPCMALCASYICGNMHRLMTLHQNQTGKTIMHGFMLLYTAVQSSILYIPRENCK